MPPPSAAELAAMLTDQTPACAAARETLLAGGTAHVFPGLVPATQNAGIYNARLQRVRKFGRATLGADETLQILRQLGDRPLRVGIIDAVDRSWCFKFYMDPDATRILACCGHARDELAGDVTRIELRHALERAGVPDGVYNLHDRPLTDCTWVLRPDGDGWLVYFVERGIRHPEARFDDEAAACAQLWGWLDWARKNPGA